MHLLASSLCMNTRKKESSDQLELELELGYQQLSAHVSHCQSLLYTQDNCQPLIHYETRLCLNNACNVHCQHRFNKSKAF